MHTHASVHAQGWCARNCARTTPVRAHCLRARMREHLHVHAHLCVCAQFYVRTHTNKCTLVRAHLRVCAHFSVRTHTNACTLARAHLRVCAHFSVRTHMDACTLECAHCCMRNSACTVVHALHVCAHTCVSKLLPWPRSPCQSKTLE